MSSSIARLGTWDYVSGSLIVAIASVIGIYQTFSARKNKQVKDFLVTNTDLSIVPLMLSIAATFTSAAGILGYPKETYNNGASYMILSFSLIFLIPLGAFVYLPLLYNLGYSSIFEYLEIRFNRSLRLCASITYVIRIMLLASVSLYAPALALNQVTGLHLWASVGSIGFLCIIYTSLGGIKAVVWADVTQYLVMIIVFLVILIMGTVDLGGIAEVWRICEEGKRTQFIILNQSPYSEYSFWTMAIGATIQFLGAHTINQHYMQRYLSNRTLTRAKITFIGGSVTVCVFTFILGMGGLVLYARYHDCDPLINGQVTSRDQIMALFAMETLGFYEGLSGAFVATILCATLSTLSSLLNAIAAITMEDYIKPYYSTQSENKKIRLSKIVAMVYGVICVALVLVVQKLDGVMQLIFAIVGIVGGPLFTVFTIGMALPWVNSWGAMAGFASALLQAIWAYTGSQLYKATRNHAPYETNGCHITSTSSLLNHTAILGNYSTSVSDTSSFMSKSDVFPLYTLSSLWYTSWGLVIGVVVSIIVSILTGPRKPSEIDPKLLFPFVQRLCSHLPERCQAFLGYDISQKKYLEVALTDSDNMSFREQRREKSSANELHLRNQDTQISESDVNQ